MGPKTKVKSELLEFTFITFDNEEAYTIMRAYRCGVFVFLYT